MQTSAMKVCFQIAECSFSYAKIVEKMETAKRNRVFYKKITPPYFANFRTTDGLLGNSLKMKGVNRRAKWR